MQKDFCGSDCSSPDLKEMLYQLVCDKIEDLEDNVQDIKISMDKVESLLSNLDLSGVESRFTEFNNALVVIQDREKNYLDNQARCNQMVNELKGIVSQVRGDYQANLAKMIKMDKKVDAIFNLLSMKDEWIDIKENVPTYAETVLVSDGIVVGFALWHREDLKWVRVDKPWENYNAAVTHWMPLPAVPNV